MTIGDIKKFISDINDDVEVKTTEFDGNDETEHDICELLMKRSLNENGELHSVVVIR